MRRLAAGLPQICCGSELLDLEPEPDSRNHAWLWALPDVGDRSQARRTGNEIAPGNRGGQDVELAEKVREPFLGLGLEDEDRFLLGQQELVLSERRSGRVEGRPLGYEFAYTGKRAHLQGHDHGCTPPRGTAKAGETVCNLLDDSGPHSGAGDEVSAVCPLHDERRPIVEAVCTTTPDAQTQNLLVAELPANGRPVALATCKVNSSRAER